jgi:hypothetical protein
VAWQAKEYFWIDQIWMTIAQMSAIGEGRIQLGLINVATTINVVCLRITNVETFRLMLQINAGERLASPTSGLDFLLYSSPRRPSPRRPSRLATLPKELQLVPFHSMYLFRLFLFHPNWYPRRNTCQDDTP